MESYDFLLALAIILLSTKLFGLATERVRLPQVVGALLAGILLGPSCLGILQETDFLVKTSEIGVIMLMFIAGLDTDLDELKSTGAVSCLIAVLGVLVPLIGCSAVYYFFFADGFTADAILKSTFIGVVFAATSVSITVETLTEMGKIKSRVGTTIVSAAIIDDIIGIVILSVISGFSDGGSSSMMVIGRILAFFVFTIIVGIIVNYIFKKLDENHGKSKRVAVWGLAFCFLLSYVAETFFGVADITGAYFAGVILCNIAKTKSFLAKKMSVSSYVFFAPVFFASVGIKTNLSGIDSSIILFTVILLIMAIVTKVIGCGLGAKLGKMSNKDSLGIGVGMISRGEVALMVAQKGIVAGLITQAVFPAIILVVIVTSLITPVLLRIVIPKESTETASVVLTE